MKKLIIVMVMVGAAGLATFWALRRPSADPTGTAESSPADTATPPAAETIAPSALPVTAPLAKNPRAIKPTAAPAPSADAGGLDDSTLLRQTVAWLVSAQTSFDVKQAGWKKLRVEGRLGEVIKELEKQTAEHPTDAAYQTALGQAYIYQISTVKDMREQAMLGMKADATFEAAIQADTANWEAQFFRATAMSFWPAELNKRPEVIAQFQKLIDQQEAMSPQPHFAQTYAWLGEQYKKAGEPDKAEQTWQRGANLFPADPALRQKMSGAALR